MNCESFETTIAEYLEDGLDAAQNDAFMAHIETCEHCRAELQAYMRQEQELARYFARDRERIEQMPNPFAGMARPEIVRINRTPARLAWAAAALVMLAMAGLTWNVVRKSVPTGGAALAVVKVAQGDVQLLDGGRYRSLAVGDAVPQGKRVKVAAGGYAALALAGANNVLEVKGGTQLTLSAYADRTEVAMYLGQVWAHLPTHPAKPFVVRTANLTATAHGTVYGVEQELDRTIVRVAEHVVDILAGGVATSVSAPGTYTSLAGAPAPSPADAVAWSEYQGDLSSLSAAAPAASVQLATVNATDAAAAVAPAPNIPKIDDLMRVLPVGTKFYVEFRNWPAVLAQFQLSKYSTVMSEPGIQNWLQSATGQTLKSELTKEMKLFEVLDIAKLLDGQVVAALGPNTPEGTDGSKTTFLFLADCRAHAEEVRQRIETFATEDAAADNPAIQIERRNELAKTMRFVNGQLAISADPQLLEATVAALELGRPTGFDASPFEQKIDAVASHAPLTLAMDLASMLDPQKLDMTADQRHFYDFVGLGSLDYMVVAPIFEGEGMNQAARIAFKSKRAGAFSWLAAPAPMRGLQFFSPEVRFFASSVVRSPHEAYYDLLRQYGDEPASSPPGMLIQLLGQHLDLLESVGGEFTIGLENPILPIPNIKVAVEMRDPEGFQRQFNALVSNMLTLIQLQSGVAAVVEQEDYKGRLIYSIAAPGSPIELSWAYVDDFMVLGPGPHFVEHSIDVYDSGRTIATDSRLLDLLPSGTGSTFSCLVYQNIAAVIPDLINSKLLGNLNDEEKKALPDVSFLSRYETPGIAYAYAGEGSIDLYLNTPKGIDLNMGMAIPVVANWLTGHIGAGAVLEKKATAEKGLDTLAAAALLFQKEKGRWPKSLDELLGEGGIYIKQIPEDPFAIISGDSLRMIAGPKEGQLTLYSVGPDNYDDRGAFAYDPIKDITGEGDVLLRLPLGSDDPTSGTATPAPAGMQRQ